TALAANLQIGTEATEYTNAKAIKIDDPNIINPYSGTSWKEVTSSSLTWVANRGISLTTGLLDSFYLAKMPYTDFASDTNVYNFADGLEQRYGVEGLTSREKQLFNRLNSIGNNEQILLYQAYDEMMGHQYSNVQQRLFSTGNSLNKEFDYLSSEWATASKQSNKIKIFGMKGEYNTGTAGIIDYTNNTYGVAYLHENETIKLGSNTGWYAGLVQNRFDFKDIGGSEENTTMGKLGIFKTMAFDNNGSLTWKISGEGMFGYSQMDRKFLVVDEIFGAESTYTSYGVALRNEISKDIRLTERTSLKPYGSLAIEYGRFSDIKEKTGEMRLEVEGNDYYSIKPEVGVEYKYKQPLFLRSNLTASLGIAYENDLGKVNDAENRARVGYTDADYFNLRGEKENRTGNGKADLKIGIENSRVGLTLDLGYDTKGENVRGGMGLRIIY
ncbi:MAG: autotransporter outer membrane beta-barrel domain-containing protein, partial [Leptotrichiaceae bacterium]